MAAVAIGSHRLTKVPAAVAQAEIRSRQDGADGIIGNSLLRRFDVIFDYAHNRIHLRPNSHSKERFRDSR